MDKKINIMNKLLICIAALLGLIVGLLINKLFIISDQNEYDIKLVYPRESTYDRPFLLLNKTNGEIYYFQDHDSAEKKLINKGIHLN